MLFKVKDIIVASQKKDYETLICRSIAVWASSSQEIRLR